jgi:hypothetical protein
LKKGPSVISLLTSDEGSEQENSFKPNKNRNRVDSSDSEIDFNKGKRKCKRDKAIVDESSDSESDFRNSPEDIYYQINAHLKQLRHEVQILALRKLARKPYKPLSNEYQAIYQTFAKLSEKAAANMKTKDDKGKTSDVEMSGDEKNKDTEENRHHRHTKSSNDSMVIQ